jgi:uncharacterized protein (TIGR02597 family)
MTSGNAKGAYYTITNNTATTLDVELIPENLSLISAGDTFRIIPFWTLNTIWPNGQGVVPSPATSGGARRTQILFPDMSSVGINIAPLATTFYFLQSSTQGTNWLTSTSVFANNQIILPDQYVTIRQPATVTATTTNTTLGQVSTYNWRIPLYAQAGGQQDSFVGLPRPSVQTLNDLGFTNNNNGNGFLTSPATSGGARRDQLLILDNTTQDINKSPNATLYYLLSSGSWRSSTDSVTDVGSTVVFQPGSGLIIRKFQTNVTQTIWSQPPNY